MIKAMTPSDATMEISEAHATHRGAQESLWFAVSYQVARLCDTAGNSPGEPRKATLTVLRGYMGY